MVVRGLVKDFDPIERYLIERGVNPESFSRVLLELDNRAEESKRKIGRQLEEKREPRKEYGWLSTAYRIIGQNVVSAIQKYLLGQDGYIDWDSLQYGQYEVKEMKNEIRITIKKPEK